SFDPTVSTNVQNSADQGSGENQEEEAELKYGASHVINLFVPVSICMVMVVFTMNTVTFYSYNDGRHLLYTPFVRETDSTSEKVLMSLGNALVMLCVVIIMTVILIFFYKYRCYKVITAWLMASSCLLLFLFSTIYLQEVMKSFNLSLSVFTVFFFLGNFGVLGIMCIHWKGPLRLQQFYLIAMSALMALVFIKYLPEWTVWSVLAMISVWDLIAVLAPNGPLRILVETAQERNEPIFPALIYSCCLLYFSSNQFKEIPGENQEEEAELKYGASHVINLFVPVSICMVMVVFTMNTVTFYSYNDGRHLCFFSRIVLLSSFHSVLFSKFIVLFIESVQGNSSEKSAPSTSGLLASSSSSAARVKRFAPQRNHRVEIAPGALSQEAARSLNEAPVANSRVHPNLVRNQEQKGVKLGLGDFIFYSVLVGKASSYFDWNTTVACYVAILVGLCFTLLLLAVFRRALPALPISIFAGLLFYFCTRWIVTPYVSEITRRQWVY
ncbi:hypothetical protein Angca_007912, partial [Angiostrongylus cantonensis]